MGGVASRAETGRIESGDAGADSGPVVQHDQDDTYQDHEERNRSQEPAQEGSAARRHLWIALANDYVPRLPVGLRDVAGTVFITRKYPPSVGGMETLAAGIWAALEADSDPGAALIAHGGANRRLPLWLPTAAWRLLVLVWRRRVDTVLTGGVVLYLLMAPLLRTLRVRRATMAMGKDLVWANRAYQRATPDERRAARGALVLACDPEGLRDTVEDGPALSRAAVQFSLRARDRYSALAMGRELRALLDSAEVPLP